MVSFSKKVFGEEPELREFAMLTQGGHMVFERNRNFKNKKAMCVVGLADMKNTESMMNMLGLNQSIDKMAKASGVRWLGNVLRRDDRSVV